MATTPFELDTLSAVKRGQAKQAEVAAEAPKEDWSKVEYELPGDEPATPAPVAAAPAAPAPAVEEEKVYEYQPTNEDGIPIGGVQRIKYRTQDELIQKMQKNHEEAIRHIRKLNTKIRVGEYEVQENIPAEAPRYENEAYLQPRDLTPEEKLQISRDMLDPEKVQDAYDRLSEARFGARPDVVVKRVNEAQMNEEALRAKAEGEAFVDENPQYYNCPANARVIVNWLQKNGLRPVRSNFKLAYETLNEAGLLLQRPTVREAVSSTVTPAAPANTQPEPATPSRITSEVQAQPVRPAREISGLSRSNAGDGDVSVTTSVSATKKALTMAEIDRMPSDEYKRRMKDPRFKEAVERLMAEHNSKMAKSGFPQ